MRKLYIFFLINILISSLISIRYFIVPGASFTFLGGSFALISVLSNFFILYLLVFLICTSFLLFNKYIRNTFVASIFGFCQIALYLDTLVFEQYRFHINQSVLELVLSGQVVDFSFITYLLMFLFVVVVFCIEWFILFVLDKKIIRNRNRNKSKKSKGIFLSTLCLLFFLLISHFGHMVAFYYAYSPIISVKEYIPIFKPLTSTKIMGLFDKNGMRKVVYTGNEKHSAVNYPKQALVINSTNQPHKNIMFIVLDSWRYDTFNEDVSPNTYQFVKQNNGVIFNNHYSTGNATRVGIFGLFYGIPGTYWDTFLRNSVPSAFVTTLQKENYNIGIFTSAEVSSPEFDRTAFVTIKNLRISSDDGPASKRDQQITGDWLKWYKNRDKNRPTFSFLFYDAPHAYDFPSNFEVKFSPVGDLNYMALSNNTDPVPIFNRYKQSVYYDDYLLKNIYSELESSGALENTLIVITGDHGQEINDNKLGYWGHNGNFTDAQTKVPFVIVGSKKEEDLKNNVNQLTTHEDIVPSLMKHYLFVENDTRDYSTGYDLLTPINERNWLLMSSYGSYAVRTKSNIYLVNHFGISHYMDATNREVNDKPNYRYISDAMNNMRYFFKESDKVSTDSSK